MKARVIRVGNSKGIRIPKPMLEEAGLEEEVDIEVVEDGLRITPHRAPRTGWADAAAALAVETSPMELDPPTLTVFDDTEWEW